MATWECNATGALGPNITRSTLTFSRAPARARRAAPHALAYLAKRLAAPNATLVWGPRLLRIAEATSLWGASCDDAFSARYEAPYFFVNGVAASAGVDNSTVLVLALSPAPALAQYDYIWHTYRVDANTTRAHDEQPLVPLVAADGALVVAAPGEPAEAAFAAHWARRRRLAPNPDATLTNTGNQVTMQYTIANFQWNYGGRLGVAAISPYQILSNVPASTLSCVNCYVNFDVSAYGSIDFHSPTWYGTCNPYCLGQVGAYIEGIADVRGTVSFSGSMSASLTSREALLAKRSAGSFTIAIAGLPLTIYMYIKVDAVLTFTAGVSGTFSYSALFYQQANVGATYNYVANNNNPVAIINQWPAPTISLPTPSFQSLTASGYSFSAVIEPTVTLSLWNVISVYVIISPELLLTAKLNQGWCTNGAAASLSFGVSSVVGMEALTWGAIHAAAGTSWMSWLLSGTILNAVESPPFSIYPPTNLMEPICTSAWVPGVAPCAIGMYTNGGMCLPCLAGHYSTQKGSSSCIRCSAGSSCFSASSAPIPCAAGTYSTGGAIACLLCAAGFQSAPGASVCTACPLGTTSLPGSSLGCVHTRLYSTGVDASGIALAYAARNTYGCGFWGMYTCHSWANTAYGPTDTHFTIAKCATFELGSCASPQSVSTYRGGDPGAPAWSSTLTDASWIGNSETGFFAYSTQFFIAADPSLVSISGSYMCDDNCKVYLNSALVSSDPPSSSSTVTMFLSATSFSAPRGSIYGVNTLVILVNNRGGENGVIASFSLVAASPSTTSTSSRSATSSATSVATYTERPSFSGSSTTSGSTSSLGSASSLATTTTTGSATMTTTTTSSAMATSSRSASPTATGSVSSTTTSTASMSQTGSMSAIVTATSMNTKSASARSSSTATAMPQPAGAPCLENYGCSSRLCRGGFCCAAAAARANCSACTAGGGGCLARIPGELCASNFDCQTNLCAGGCCCSSSALQIPTCSSCKCWDAPNATAADMGSCLATPPPLLASFPGPIVNATLACTSNTSTEAAVAPSAVIAFPAVLNVTDAVPLLFLPATSPLNTMGIDVILASPSACSAYATLGGSTQCSHSRAFATDAGIMFFLGTAAALGMVPAPACAA
jgi:hypothetical protein